ncbi:cell division transport system permease protein [Chitinophaga ginsengisegetis]|uniref:Cell division protein FtsX n=1 Tax=Chitinophaga ginsengisegetis TaxID=393003 RepID=A0A1T5PD13_9BACT|nr:permease-like cell division protein FtsX [Chitinophaga ginsengisegetis]MDR6570238.1 cell division transport system permease protein [Chitinophaga ginsengisegetis]MDR6649972.1 cell division transport system permease protein [Chitinophaga ginsengisegetis]MDR6656387.1 cell division transport system permease protein [Chitinophaga ginsengisegetis]SKD10388.1 cell division transport system permease protein [Chitinophaga ginsengisegetis]
MAQSGKSSAKKSKPSYLYSIIGVALVLFLLGTLGLVVIHANKLSVYFKESIEIQVILRDNVKEAQATALRDSMAHRPYIKSIEYVSKDMAAQRFKKDFGEDFISLLQYNPLYSSINIKANANYVNNDSLKVIENNLSQQSIVREISYQRMLVSKLNENVNRIGLIILIISGLLCLVVIFLIDNTIRLAMFSNRFLIKTMQMVGATRWFIAKPFDLRSIANGAIAAVIAIAGLIGIMSVSDKLLPELAGLRDNLMIAFLFIGMILIGISISLVSTHRSVMKYLRLKLDDLY